MQIGQKHGVSVTAAFRHQRYSGDEPTTPCFRVPCEPTPAVDSPEGRERLRAIGARWRAERVRYVCLVHGTFVGDDALGLLADLERWFPESGRNLRESVRQVINKLAGDYGNFSPEYLRLLQAGLNEPGEPAIDVLPLTWSSENHHIGRSDGAVRLLDRLSQLPLEPSERVMFWGHSHAGNVFALMSNLLSGDLDGVMAFFHAARLFYRTPLRGRFDLPHWGRVRALLTARKPRWNPRQFDFVTFGTPIRYGWHRAGLGRLLHVVFHRPHDEARWYLGKFPPALADVLSAEGGDYVQQLAIAGTNTPPGWLALRSALSDSRLNRLLQSEYSLRDLLKRLRRGHRIADTGTTVLVDYGPQSSNVAEHLAGHVLYTQTERLLFHAELVAKYLDSCSEPDNKIDGEK